MFPDEDECDGCGAVLPVGRRGTPTGKWTFLGNLVCWICEEALNALETDLNPEWVKAGPEANVTFCLSPDFFDRYYQQSGEVREKTEKKR